MVQIVGGNALSGITGGCLCRAVEFSAGATVRAVHYCHCSMCRRATGGPLAVIVWIPKAEVRWRSNAPESRASSEIARRSFCPRCGTPISLQYNNSDEIGFMVGCLDDPDRFEPTYHYGIEGRLRWCDAGSSLSERRVTQEQLVPQQRLRPDSDS